MPRARLDDSVERILRAKASLGLYKERLVELSAVPAKVGGRTPRGGGAGGGVALDHVDQGREEQRAADRAGRRGDPVPVGARLPERLADRRAEPDVHPRAEEALAQGDGDRALGSHAAAELDLVRATAPRYAAIVASVFVRATSGSGRMDLAPELARLLSDLARITDRASVPMVTTFFGNPYTASFVPELPAMLLTYDVYDNAERAAVARDRRRGADQREAADHAVAGCSRRDTGWSGRNVKLSASDFRQISKSICRADRLPLRERKGFSRRSDAS